MEKVDLSIIMVSFGTQDLTTAAIKSVLDKTKGISYEVIVVDNASQDDSVHKIKSIKDSKLKLIENKDNIGFAKANNQAVKQATGRYIVFLNSDTLVKDNLLAEMVDWMDKNEGVGIATCKLVGKDGSLQEAGGYFPTLLSVFSWMTIQDLPLVDNVIKPFHPLGKKSFLKKDSFFTSAQKLDWVIGAFLLIRRTTLEQIGGWDPEYFMYTEDVDICYRARQKKWEVWYLPQWQITHFGGSSSTTREYPLLSEYKGVKLFYKKHYPKWKFLFLRLFLKIGALGRMILFGILEGAESAKIYAKAFKQA